MKSKISILIAVLYFITSLNTNTAAQSVINDQNHKVEHSTSIKTQTPLNKPIIGISSYTDGIISKLSMTYVESVRKAGGIPFIIPLTTDSLQITEIIESIDGLIMSGGEDLSPHYYNEDPHAKLGEVVPERDTFDILLITKALEKKKPLLAICRGEQILNVVCGGSLYQDIPSQHSEALQHKQNAPRNYGSHTIEIETNSLLYKLLRTRTIRVNSFHHQAVKDLGKGLFVSSKSPDGIVESIEIKGEPVLGVQFHPEGFVFSDDLTFLPIFKWLVESATIK